MTRKDRSAIDQANGVQGSFITENCGIIPESTATGHLVCELYNLTPEQIALVEAEI
jgi:hypothetical protein